jgi:hypothetical protein
MRLVAALALSKVFLVLLALLIVLGAIRGRLRLQLRLVPDRSTAVPTRWALSVGTGARLHRRLQTVADEVAPHAPPRGRRFRKSPAPGATQQAAAAALEAALRADQALARAARAPKPERRAALRAASQQVVEVERLAERATSRAAADAHGGVLDATATVVRLDP